MSSEKTTKKNRYPGIRSFEADDKRLFYGRSKEIEDLFHLIKIKSLVVLFGKSGLGKTSLLKAGVGPLLQKQHFYPLIIRLQDTSVSPADSTLNTLEQFVDAAQLKKFGNKSGNKIWECLKACSFKTATGQAATPVLVFDQFEELFNHPKNVLEEWSDHIGELIDGRLPSDIEDALNHIPRSERSPELMAWFRPPEVKVIFAIRSDRMSELHKLRHEIPAILQNRYELKPLHTQQARAAVEKPAALSGAEFSALPFTFAPETITKIEKELSNERDEIESFQLQIVCQHTEQMVKQEQDKGAQDIEVTPDYLGGKDGIKNILKNYYNTQIASLGTKEEQMAAQKLLEEGLIMNERRISVAEAVVSETYDISETLLGKLLSSRLIRPEDTRLGRTYEISHDTLVKPILEAYEKRRIKDIQLAAIEAQKEQAKKTWRKVIIGLSSVIGIVLISLTAFAFHQSKQLKNALESLTEKNELLEASIKAYADQKGITTEVAEQEIEKDRIRELEKEIKEIENKLQDEMIKIRDLEHRLDDTRKEGDKMKREYEKTHRSVKYLQSQLEELNEESSKLDRELGILKKKSLPGLKNNRISELEAEIKRHTAEKQKKTYELRSVKVRISKLKEVLTKNKGEEKIIISELEAAQNRAAVFYNEKKVAEEALLKLK